MDVPRPDRRATVLCCGQATLDHVFTVPGSVVTGHKQAALAHEVVGGGVAANAAVAVSRLGGDAALVSCVGADEAGDEVLRELRREGVDTASVRRLSGLQTPVSAVVVGADGGRTVVNHTPGALFERPGPRLDGRAADAVMVDGRWPAATVGVLRYARERGVPAVVDVDRVGRTTDWDETIALATHLIVAEDALAELTGRADVEDGLARLAASTGACVAVTLGARGVLWIDRDGPRRLPAFEVVAVDTTAAGDVFHGACALALAEGADVAAAFRFAAAAAAVKCTRAGARQGIPDRDAVRALLARRPTEVVA